MINITNEFHKLHHFYMLTDIIQNIKTAYFISLFQCIILILIAFVPLFVNHYLIFNIILSV